MGACGLEPGFSAGLSVRDRGAKRFAGAVPGWDNGGPDLQIRTENPARRFEQPDPVLQGPGCDGRGGAGPGAANEFSGFKVHFHSFWTRGDEFPLIFMEKLMHPNGILCKENLMNPGKCMKISSLTRDSHLLINM